MCGAQIVGKLHGRDVREAEVEPLESLEHAHGKVPVPVLRGEEEVPDEPEELCNLCNEQRPIEAEPCGDGGRKEEHGDLGGGGKGGDGGVDLPVEEGDGVAEHARQIGGDAVADDLELVVDVLLEVHGHGGPGDPVEEDDEDEDYVDKIGGQLPEVPEDVPPAPRGAGGRGPPHEEQHADA